MNRLRWFCIVCISCLLFLSTGFMPAVSSLKKDNDDIEFETATKLEMVLKGIEVGFQVYNMVKFGGDIAKEKAGPKPAEDVLEEVEKQGELINAVQDGLNEIQEQLADMYSQLNLYDSMQNAWNQIPNIITYYDQLNKEILETDWTTDINDRVRKWAYDVAGLNNPNIENAISQFHTALYTGGIGANQSPVLLQMRDLALNEISGQSVSSDFSCTVESTNGIGIVAERPMYFRFMDLWDGGHCQSGMIRQSKEHYFAEGTTRPGFESYFCIQNAEETEALIQLTYMRGDASTYEQSIRISPRSRSTVHVNGFLGVDDSEASDFSARVVSINDIPVIVERSIYFKYENKWSGGHCNSGLHQTSDSFFLAEGTTRPGFDSYICVQNPSNSQTDVKITYLKGDLTTQEQMISIPAHARRTIRVSDIIGSASDASHDFSALVESVDGTGIVVERPMYFDYENAWLGGHCESGITETRTTSYFAEGTTRPGFHSYICLMNPYESDSDVLLTYNKGDKTSQEQRITVPAKSRQTICVNDVIGNADTEASDFSVKVETLNDTKIAAERAIYFKYRNKWSGGHCESGLPEAYGKYYFAEGTVRPNFEPYICIQNPEDRDAEVKITYMKGDGGSFEQDIVVAGRSRFTLNVAESYPAGSLMDAYERYLESFFLQCLFYQTMGAVVQCNALDYLYPNDPNNGSEAWLKKTYLPWIREETNLFLSCVDQLVMSRVDLTKGGWNNPSYMPLPENAKEIFARAEIIRLFALGEIPIPEKGSDIVNMGLFGKLLSTQDIVPHGTVPAVTANKKNGGVWQPSYSDNMGFNWIDDRGNARKYDCWPIDTAGIQHFYLTGQWETPRYVFNDAEQGTYDIKDASGKVVATVDVTATPFENPLNNGETNQFVYGYFLATQRNAFVCDANKWIPYSTVDQHSDSYGQTYDTKGGRAGIWYYMDHKSHSANIHSYIWSKNFIADHDDQVHFYYDIERALNSNQGDNWEKYPYGFAYCKTNWVGNSANSHVYYQLSLQDMATGNYTPIHSDSIKAETTGGNYSPRGHFSDAEKSGSTSIALTKGKEYRLHLHVYATLKTSSSSAQANFLARIKYLNVSDR